MSKELKQFIYRVWNTVKYPLLSILLAILGTIITDVTNAGSLSVLKDLAYWDKIAVSFLGLVAGTLGIGSMAGVDKLLRVKK